MLSIFEYNLSRCISRNHRMVRLSFKILLKKFAVPQSFSYENHCECYKKLASRLWPVLFTLISYLFFSYKYTLFCWKIKSCDRCFSQQIKPQTTIHRPLKRHILNPIKHLRWKLMAYSHCQFSQKKLHLRCLTRFWICLCITYVALSWF